MKVLFCCLVLLLLAAATATPAQLPGLLRSTDQVTVGKLLVASEYYMKDPLFSQTVLLIVQLGKKGTVGLILNHPTRANVHQVFPEIDEAWHISNPVFIGGPVAPHQFFLLVRTNERHENSLQVMDDVSFISDPNTIKKWLAEEHHKDRIRLFAGCAGWSPGQLENEIKIGGWNLTQADAKIIFEANSSDLWKNLTARANQQEVRFTSKSQSPTAK